VLGAQVPGAYVLGTTLLGATLLGATAAGAMVLALMTATGRIPELALSLDPVAPVAQATVAEYAEKWRRLAAQI